MVTTKLRINNNRTSGFTLVEITATVAIIGILSAVALPNHINNIHKTCQREAANSLSILSTTVGAYKNINGSYPSTWLELSEVNVVMTDEGPADGEDGELTDPITSAACDYKIRKSSDDPLALFTFSATPTPNTGTRAEYNAMSCIDLNNGASDLKLGRLDADGAVTANDLTCRKTP